MMKIALILGIDQDEEIEIVQQITNIQSAIPMDDFAGSCIEQITIHADRLEIKIKLSALSILLSDTARIKINCADDKSTATLMVPYTFRRARKGALVIEPEKNEADIFNIPSHELKKLVQGFIWREEHFSGMAIKDIALRESYSQSYVGTAIFSTFEVLKAA